ncbi:potassium channel family protein [Marinicella sp. W31]|uniref:potassium channel family protein n=1 Tax=Marinicella sp. W31 TaxID=3023713 RepID=UPI0037567A29
MIKKIKELWMEDNERQQNLISFISVTAFSAYMIALAIEVGKNPVFDKVVNNLILGTGLICGFITLYYAVNLFLLRKDLHKQSTAEIFFNITAIYIVGSLLITFYGAIAFILNKATDITGSPNEFIETIYFSSITYLSIGYGDISPTNNVGRFLSVFIGYCGHINSLLFITYCLYVLNVRTKKFINPL